MIPGNHSFLILIISYLLGMAIHHINEKNIFNRLPWSRVPNRWYWNRNRSQRCRPHRESERTLGTYRRGVEAYKEGIPRENVPCRRVDRHRRFLREVLSQSWKITQGLYFFSSMLGAINFFYYLLEKGVQRVEQNQNKNYQWHGSNYLSTKIHNNKKIKRIQNKCIYLRNFVNWSNKNA